MRLFGKRPADVVEEPQVDPEEERRAAQREREGRWRQDFRDAVKSLRAARSEHAEAKRQYERYAPGPQKDAAGDAMNQAADRLGAAEREYAAAENFPVWDRNH
ncbi:hypothetical protein [Streptosporangium lutulentum]|uniref:Regulator of protease activity HflC (Stomatin/prohibitin superfamily) n=1 Tax=Streptosporangium lutulentum TaxID=1461250 RepID=A0ABT9Q982_9ACTN|nr:hypothetical protein [Streptosporangium lutulentum]MDP9843217.1 regulator of protease activity HflC (stomatin/prohibitin superfamily) [Streptosporangium lutulentum]